jgi:hypothetical protein
MSRVFKREGRAQQKPHSAPRALPGLNSRMSLVSTFRAGHWVNPEPHDKRDRLVPCNTEPWILGGQKLIGVSHLAGEGAELPSQHLCHATAQVFSTPLCSQQC